MEKIKEVKEIKVEVLELQNYQASVLTQVYGKIYNIDFTKEEFDDAIIIANEGAIIEDALKAYSKLERSITDKVEKLRNDKGEISIDVLNKANSDLMELSYKITKLKEPLSDTVKKYINKITIKPKEIKILKDLGLL